METMRYQENKKNSKWPIFAFLVFVIVGGLLIFIGVANENEPEIIGSAREEVQGLVDIESKETISKNIIDETSINDIEFKVEDVKISDKGNSKFKADFILPKITINSEELTEINEEILKKYNSLFTSVRSEMSSVENSFTFKTSYKYYDNVVGDKRILSITVYQRILDDKDGNTTTDKVETYNINLKTKQKIEEKNVAQLMLGKEYKTIIKNSIKKYVLDNKMMNENDFVYAITGLENYYIKENIFHIILNEGELVDKKYGVLDIEVENENIKK